MSTIEAAKWQEAARDLAFKFVAPFTLRDGTDSLSYLGWLPQFGPAAGMLIITEDDLTAQEKLIRAAKSQGFGYSCVTTSSEPYDRDIFIDLLCDWGWSSSDPRPAWYDAHCESDA